MPASGNVSGSNGERLSALRRRIRVPTPGFGPLVVIFMVTVVAPAPAAIDAGMKTQLLFVSVGSVGAKLHAKVTAAPKVPPEVGVATKE